METRRAPEESKSGSVAMGTIGFDMYLALLGVDRRALKTPKNPS